jgi:drug/metabolite transporter (DMT)-like permease
MTMTPRQLWALLALTFMWGINWPMMKLSLQSMPPLHFRAITMTGGTIWMMGYLYLKGIPLWPRKDQWPSLALLAIPNMLGWHTFAILGVKELASGRAAILGFTMPVWTVLISVFFLGEKLSARVAFAVLCALTAITLLVWQEFATITGRPLGVLWMEIAAISWAIGTLMIRRTHLALSAYTVTIWMMVMTSVALWVIASLAEPWPFNPMPDYTWQFWGSVAYGIFINYGIAQLIWFGLAKNLPPATSAMSVMAVPLIGTLSATLIVGEQPHWQDYAAIVFVMLAIASVLLPQRKKTI